MNSAYSTALLDAALDCIILMNHEGIVVEFNLAAERTFGYSRAEAIGREMAELVIPPYLRMQHRAGLARYLATGEGPVLDTRLEITGWRANGQEFPVELAITRLPSEGPPVFAGFLRDITARKEDERRLAAHYAIAHVLVDADTIEDAAANVLAALGENLQWDGSIFWLAEQDRQPGAEGEPILRAVAHGYRPNGSRGGDRDVAAAIAARAVQLLPLAPYAADDPPEPFDAAAGETPDGTASDASSPAAVAFVIRDGARVVGMVEFIAGQGAAPLDDEQRRMLDSIGSEVGQFLRRKRLEAEVQRAHDRQSDIAQRLQDAIRPTLSGEFPGLETARYYRPALEEASVGGDFFDVFTLGRNVSALVVGDLSGKGVAAAAQIATVRHMLRALLYEHSQNVPHAMTLLNGMLVEHDLLKGFATLFLGVYDADQRSLTCICCGHEPALVLRQTTGVVEEIWPTGPLLGVYQDATFGTQAVSLEPGDVFAIYTDGLTEAGKDRRALLGVSGVEAAFRASGAMRTDVPVRDLPTRMMAAIEAAATPAGIRDDVCLLVARVV